MLPPPSLTISIVLFRTDTRLLLECLNSLAQAVDIALQNNSLGIVRLVLVDNNPDTTSVNGVDELPAGILASFHNIEWVRGHGNIGYGRGHNLAILQSTSDYHLVLNPDVVLATDAIIAALDFMQRYPQAGLLAPAVQGADGTIDYLCKRYPAVADLLLRGFAPAGLQRLFKSRLARYEMRDVINAKLVWDVPLVSGCFMWLRGSVVRSINGFDPAYFLYFEDYDLSIRIAAAKARTVYVPSVCIVHYGGHAARKGWHHIAMFMRAALRFYNTHGWRLL